MIEELKELTQLLEELHAKGKIRHRIVCGFQNLIREEGLSSKNITYFPYPMAIFCRDGYLAAVNLTISKETGLTANDLLITGHNILNRITNANLPILDAVEEVFKGKTMFLSNLYEPLNIFIRDITHMKKSASRYQNAIFFPIAEAAGKASHGAAIFMQ